MNKKEKSERSLYVKPECNLLNTNIESILQSASGNAGRINPGQGAGVQNNHLSGKMKM